jgi:hypothetical protein
LGSCGLSIATPADLGHFGWAEFCGGEQTPGCILPIAKKAFVKRDAMQKGNGR